MDYELLAEQALIDEKPLKALHYFQQAYAQNPLSDFLVEIALIYQELGNDEEARCYYEKALQDDPEHHLALYGLGTIYDDAEDYERAVSYYEKAIQSNPLFDRAYFFLAGAYDQLGEKDLAIEAYKHTLDFVPDDFWALTNLGSIYEESKRYELAYKYFKLALKSNGAHPTALFNMGVILGRLQQFDVAISYYEKALKLDATNPYTYLNLAVIYKNQGNIPHGIQLLTEGILATDQPFLYYNRACFYALIKQNDLSLQDLQIAIKRYPDFGPYSQKDPDLQNILPMLKGI